MYLLEIDTKTGLVRDDATFDSWKGISCFRELVEAKGLKALTVIAFSVDYESPFRNYKESDRFFRAQEEIYDNRKELKLENALIQKCLLKYSDLQFNEDLEQNQIFRDIKIDILDSLSQARRDKDSNEIAIQTRNLQNHEATLKSFKERFDRSKALESAVTATGYVLSRIENDIATRKNSKFVDKKHAKNPNQLGLQQ